MNFDIAIIGGGPAGYTAAERAGANGLKAVLFEKKAMGGVCLNEGCIPTKTLLYSAKILDSIKSASKYGVSAESPSFDLSKIMSRKDKTVKMLTGGVKMTVNSYGVTIVEKEAFIEGENEGMIRITCDGETYSGMYRLRYSDSSHTGIVGSQLLDFQGGVGDKRASQDAGYYWRWSDRDGICFFLQQHGSKGACGRNDAGDFGSDG